MKIVGFFCLFFVKVCLEDGPPLSLVSHSDGISLLKRIYASIVHQQPNFFFFLG